MSRTLTAFLLVASLCAGCAATSPTASNVYCFNHTTGGCSALEGDGACQPCPDSSWRAAQGDAPTRR